jgi:hypothetical protein
MLDYITLLIEPLKLNKETIYKFFLLFLARNK